MKNEIDILQVMRVFEKIRSQGEARDDGHYLDGVTARSDFDGYTLYLSDAQSTLTVFFHNKYHFDYPSEQALEDFTKRLHAIDKNH